MLTASALLLGGCGDAQRVEVEVGYRGLARINPYLAAERFLTEMGRPAHSLAGLGELPEYGNTLMLPAGAVRSQGAALRLEEWIYSGGHLIYLLEGGEGFLNDWLSDPAPKKPINDKGEVMDPEPEPEATEDKDNAKDKDADADKDTDDDEEEDSAWAKIFGHEDREDPLLRLFGIERVDAPRLQTTVNLKREEYRVVIPGAYRVKYDDKLGRGSHASPSREEAAFLSLRRGVGRITVLTHAQPFRSRYLDDRDHARLLLAVTGLKREGDIWLVYGTDLPFWAMLWEKGWMPLLALLALVIFWLWKNLPRFGPLLDPEPSSSRDFAEHIGMTAQFLWRHRCDSVLVKPVREDIIATIRRKWLHVGEYITDDHYERLAHASGLSKDQIIEALESRPGTDPAAMTRIMRSLQKMKSVL